MMKNVNLTGPLISLAMYNYSLANTTWWENFMRATLFLPENGKFFYSNVLSWNYFQDIQKMLRYLLHW